MAQLVRGQADESEQAQLFRELTATQNPSQNNKNASKLSGCVSHDQLCDNMHEKVLNSELAMKNISSSSMQERGRSLSMQERRGPQNCPNVKKD